MAILIRCECGRQFEASDEYAGRRARCPECGRTLIVPQPGTSPYAPPKFDPGIDEDFGGPIAEKTSGKAIASLVLGISSLICSITVIFGLLTGIPAIVLGSLGLGEIGRSKGRLKGHGMAVSGIVMGAIACTILPIAIAIGLLLPAVQAAREAARRAQCTNNLKHIGLAMYNFASDKNRFPAAVITDSGGKPLLSWRVAILPYIEQQALYQKFKLDEPWDSPHNLALLAEMPRTYACPSDPEATKHVTRYEAIVGPGTAFEGTTGVSSLEITDGTSNTLLVVEGQAAVPWTKPEDLDFAPNAPLPALGGFHPGGANALFADGSVRFLKKSLSPATLKALITRNGGEVISADSQ